MLKGVVAGRFIGHTSEAAMTTRITWTHGYNLMAKVLMGILEGGLLLGILVPMPDAPMSLVWAVVCASVVVNSMLYVFFLRHLANWLYARFTLGAPVLWRDASSLQYLFSLDRHRHWLPMLGIRELPEHARRGALLAAEEQARTTREFDAARYL